MNFKPTALSLSTGVILCLICYILYLTQCNPCDCPIKEGKVVQQPIVTTTQPKTDTVFRPGDTIRILVKIPTRVKGKDSIVFVEKEVVKQVPARIDTQAILQDYYSKVIQMDSLRTPDVVIHTVDTTYKNRVIGRWWSVQQIKTQPKVKRKFYFGGELYSSMFMNGARPTQAISAGKFGLGYINRKEEHFTLGLMRSGGLWHQGIGFYHTFK